MGFVGDILGFGGDDPGKAAAQASIQGSEKQAEASRYAAQLAAHGQREGLEYLKERERLPRQFSEGALQRLGGLSGLPGGVGSQQELIERAQASPLYGAITGAQEAGEEAILRNAAATGGLRSGNVQSALSDYTTQLQNQALLESYNQELSGLRGLAGLPSYAPQIASQMGGIGQTLGSGALQAGTAQAQGQIAAGQALLSGQQSGTQNLLGLAGLGLGAYGLFS